jgi:hypothetical protein
MDTADLAGVVPLHNLSSRTPQPKLRSSIASDVTDWTGWLTMNVEQTASPVSARSGKLDSKQTKTGRPVGSRPGRIFRVLAAATIAAGAILVLTSTMHFQHMDFLEYWSSAKLLIHHADPYSPAGVFALEKSQGRPAAAPLVMLNPPWTLFLITPLGLGGVRTGLFLWTVAAAGCVFISSRLIDVPSNDRALAFLFAPFLACIVSGQSSPFLLLGFSLFLYFYRSRPFLAGASLLLMAIKPHLFLIFWVLLLVDCIYRRRYLILAGGASALAIATAFSMLFDLHIWRDYLAMLSVLRLRQGFLPTASMVFRTVIDARAVWLLFVPSALALVWALWYYSRWKQQWDWRIHGMLLMIVAIVASPYGFFSDEIVLLPSISFALAQPEKRRYAGWILLAINSAAMGIALFKHADLSSRGYIWTPLAWLAWFLYATYRSGHRSQSSSVRLAETLQTGRAG